MSRTRQLTPYETLVLIDPAISGGGRPVTSAELSTPCLAQFKKFSAGSIVST